MGGRPWPAPSAGNALGSDLDDVSFSWRRFWARSRVLPRCSAGSLLGAQIGRYSVRARSHIDPTSAQHRPHINPDSITERPQIVLRKETGAGHSLTVAKGHKTDLVGAHTSMGHALAAHTPATQSEHFRRAIRAQHFRGASWTRYSCRSQPCSPNSSRARPSSTWTGSALAAG